MAAIDRILPAWDVRTRHGLTVPGAPQRALAAALAVPAAPDLLARLLLGARGLRLDGSVREALDRMGFDTLVDAPTELVAGASGRPWRLAGHIEPFAAAAPGTVRIVTELRATAHASRSLLETETRVQAVDDAARLAFARYWQIVRPFSGVIRKRWLLAAKQALGE